MPTRIDHVPMGDLRVARETLVEHVPGIEAKSREHEQGVADPIEQEPCEKLRDAARQPVARGGRDEGKGRAAQS